MTAIEFTPKAGETVFSEDGRQAEYVAAREEGHIVMPLYREDDDEFETNPWAGEPQLWFEVFEKAPVPVVDKDVAEATAELQRLQTQVSEEYQKLNTMREERRALAADQNTIRERLKENEALRNIDAFLTGGITHFVKAEYVPTIETADETLMRSTNRSGKELRLLGLFGDSERSDVRWKVCAYGDGSGGSMTAVIPCLSLEEARERAAALLVSTTFPCLRSGKLSSYHGDEAVALAADLGIPVPEDIATKVAEQVRVRAAERLAQTRKSAALCTEQLEQAIEAARSAGVPIEGGAA